VTGVQTYALPIWRWIASFLQRWLRAGGTKGSDPAPDRRRGWRRARESCPRHPPTRAARSPPHLDRAAPGTPALASPRTRPRSVPAPRRTASPARARPGGAGRRWWSASWLGKKGATQKCAKLTAPLLCEQVPKLSLHLGVRDRRRASFARRAQQLHLDV